MTVDREPFAYLDHPYPIALAHRGGTENHTENSLEAFKDAYQVGIRFMETDVHLTSDGVIVAFHDPTLDRVLGQNINIEDFSWQELLDQKLPCGAKIPALRELFDAFPDAKFNIDMKSDRVVEPLLALINKTGMLDRVCLASFRDHRIWHARKELGNGLCTSAGRVAVVRQILRGKGLPMKKSNAAVLQVPLRKFGVNVVTPQFLKKAHRDGHFVHVWTVNAKEDMHRLLEMGVDGIMTDRPRLLRSVMEERGEWILADN